MSYAELIARALKGRSVNRAAKELHLSQRNLDRYVKGERLPDFTTARILAKEAGIDDGEALAILANEEEKKKSKLSYNTTRADVAQSVEQLIRNQ